MPKVRHVFQPREEVEVSDQEAEVLRAQGLLFEGDLEQLLASDPSGPLDPPYKPQAAAPAKPAAAVPSSTQPAAAAQKEN